jgi:hypothetical protein
MTYILLSPSLFSARLVITLRHCATRTSVYSIYDSAEEAIRKMIEASQTMIREQNNPAIKRHLELGIRTLQTAPRDEEKLTQLLKVKEREKEEAMHIEDIQRLVTEEIEILNVVLRLVVREGRRSAS